MKKSEALLLEQERTRREVLAAGKELAIQALKSPVLQMLLAVALVEIGQRIYFDGEHQLITETTGNAIETVVISAAGIKAIGDSVSGFMPKVSVG